MIELTILTLNIWGIPYISTDRTVRVKAIANELAVGNYDIVSLQEVWSKQDYEYLRTSVASVLPYAHYFHSGVFGSGLCVLSKFPIVETFFHAWSVNGYFHRIQHGDWFGGKGVGLAKILVANKIVNFYVAHLHAEYDRDKDDYKSHRIIQSIDTAQFIELTRGNAILQILAGDLNTEPEDLSYNLLLSSAKLVDSVNESQVENISIAKKGTNEHFLNSYTSEEAKKLKSIGKRIDYILYRSGQNWMTTVNKHSFPFPDYIPSDKKHTLNQISFSDHEAISTKFTIQPTGADTDANAEKNSYKEKCSDLLKNGINICEDALEQVNQHKRTYLQFGCALFIAFMFLIDRNIEIYGLQYVFLLLKITLLLLVVFCLFMATVWNSMEHNGILSGKLSMTTLLKAIDGQ